jgi:ribosomal-protein-alanine N-acetyltransferase
MESNRIMETDQLSGPHLPDPADLLTIFSEVCTPRLLLRRLRAADGPDYFAVQGDPLTNQYNPAGPDADLAASEKILEMLRQHWESYGFGYWAAVIPQTDTIIGFGGVRYLFWRNRHVLNLYYRFRPAAWGQGYASELAQTAISLAQKHLPGWPVVARIRPGNTASMKTAERAGLVRRPDLDTEFVVYAMDWKPGEDCVI